MPAPTGAHRGNNGDFVFSVDGHVMCYDLNYINLNTYCDGAAFYRFTRNEILAYHYYRPWNNTASTSNLELAIADLGSAQEPAEMPVGGRWGKNSLVWPSEGLTYWLDTLPLSLNMAEKDSWNGSLEFLDHDRDLRWYRGAENDTPSTAIAVMLATAHKASQRAAAERIRADRFASSLRGDADSIESLEVRVTRRHHIPDAAKVQVWQECGGACVACSATTDLQFDHIIPVALGGASTVANLQLLCGSCNRDKGAGLY